MKQKILRTILISCLLITSFLLSGTAYAQDEDLPDPGITPDSPFYLFDTLGKKIGMFFAFGPEAKAKKALQYAEERLAEAQAMAVKNRIREMTQAADDYDGFMAMVNQRAAEVRQRGISDNITERVALATSKHLQVLDRIKDKVPDQAKEAIARARTASLNGQENALRALAKAKPERAIEINLATIESRLNRARIKASENVTAEVEVALDYATRLAEIEEEMVAIAQEKGIDITSIEKRLAQSTSNRLEVLTGVYEKVPEAAQPAIKRAIENSVSKYERAVAKLKEKNALGEIPEVAPVLQKIQEEVTERFKLKTPTEAQVSENTSDNATIQARLQAEVQKGVKANVGEQTSKLEPEKSKPAVSANKTQETNKEPASGNASGRSP